VIIYLVSLLMGLAVGVAYGLVHVRSPAPPEIALLGLLGMLAGNTGHPWRYGTSASSIPRPLRHNHRHIPPVIRRAGRRGDEACRSRFRMRRQCRVPPRSRKSGRR
jgi:XapX domain-containing protein